jgi:ankyrin repeat protein
MLSTIRGNLRLIDKLLEHGAKINAKNQEEKTALVFAIEKKVSRTALFLLQNGASPNLLINASISPLELAIRSGHLPTVKVFAGNGANINFGTSESHSVFSCCSNNQPEILEYLLSRGVNSEVKDKTGSTALIVACKTGKHAIVRVILAHKAKTNSRTNEGQELLSSALRGLDFPVADALIDGGVDVDAVDKKGHSHLYRACRMGQDDLVLFLIQKGANINLKTFKKKTPLFVAAKKGHLKVVNILLSSGATKEDKCHNGATPFLAACERGKDRVVDVLYQSGCDLYP